MKAATSGHSPQNIKRKGKRRWLKIILVAPFAIIAMMVIAGLVYQAVSEALDARRYPPPGQQVDVGGYRLHLYCLGERRTGAPEVILDASHPATSSSWIWVQPEVAATTQVCSYDRAGAGWSDRSSGPPTMGQMAHDLHRLLEQASESGPFILVGHSWGGGVTRLFASAYPEQVSGLVWIEAIHPDNWSRRGLSESTFGGLPPGQIAAIPTFTRLGFFRLFPGLLGGWGGVPGLPAKQQAEFTAYFNSAKWADHVVAVERALPESLEQLRQAGGVGSTPLAIVTGTASGEADEVGSALQQELAALSSHSTIYSVAGADHSSLVHDRRYANEITAIILQLVAEVQAVQR